MSDRHPGPLVLPLSPPSTEAARAVRQRLQGHSTAGNWLPEGLWPELDAIRSEHLRIRSQVVAQLDALEELQRRSQAGDKQHAERLRQAHRETGKPDQVKDRRTLPRRGKPSARQSRRSCGAAFLCSPRSPTP
jgi:hypothetical protein